MKISKLLTLSATLVGVSISQASTVAIYDDSFSFNNLSEGTFELRWGTWNGIAFTPFFGLAANENNAGYIDLSTPEFAGSLQQTDNTLIPAGTSLALAFTTLADDAAYVSNANEVILIDPSWVAPTFVFLNTFTSYELTANTTAVKGLYQFNGGNQIISAIPEPSSFAALAGFAVLGLAASRRRRA